MGADGCELDAEGCISAATEGKAFTVDGVAAGGTILICGAQMETGDVLVDPNRLVPVYRKDYHYQSIKQECILR